MRWGPGIARRALTTSGTLPKGSITRISRMVAESSSDRIASGGFQKDAEVYRPSEEYQRAEIAIAICGQRLPHQPRKHAAAKQGTISERKDIRVARRLQGFGHHQLMQSVDLETVDHSENAGCLNARR